MFGKRRDKDEQNGNYQEEPQTSTGSFGGPFMPQTSPTQLPESRPLYAGNPPEDAGGIPDAQFAANLDADLASEEPASSEQTASGEDTAFSVTEDAPLQQEQAVATEEYPVTTATEPVSEQIESDPTPTPKAMRGISKDGDQMLGLLSTIESQLGELQRLKADRESLIDDLEHARQELDTQRELLDEREKSVAALEDEARENQRITESMLAGAEEREREIEKSKAELDEQRERTEQLERSLDERSVQLESRDAELRRRMEELETREQNSEQRDAAIRDEIKGDFEQRIGELNEALDTARAEVDDMRRQLDERNAEIDAIRTEAEARLQQRESELNAEFESRIESEKTTVDERVTALGEELADTHARAERATRSVEEEIAKREELESRIGELTAKLETAEREAAQAAERVSSMESEQGEASHVAEQSNEQRAQLEAELARTRDQLAEAGRHLSEAEERAREAGQKAESLAGELESVKAQAQNAPATTAEPAGGVDPAEIMKRDRAIELLKSKLDQAMTRVKQLEGQAAPAGASADPQQKAALEELQQKLLAKQQELDVASHKLAAREKALDQKGDGAKPMSPMGGSATAEEREAIRKEAEQLFAQREKLAEAKSALDRKAKKVAARDSKSKAANLMLSAVVTMAILALMSWYAAGQFAKPVHVASIELGADPQATDLSARQLEAWQGYHEALLDDPQFHELAARRLKQRGYAEFATPSDVRTMIADGRISMESSADGRLTLLYTADGYERTQRVLDTFSGSLSGFANETRDHRFDGAATAIITPVSADPTPVKDPRMNLFAILFGGSCAVALFGSIIMWRRMSGDMSQFEDRLADGLEFSPAEIGPTEGAASTEGRRLMF